MAFFMNALIPPCLNTSFFVKSKCCATVQLSTPVNDIFVMMEVQKHIQSHLIACYAISSNPLIFFPAKKSHKITKQSNNQAQHPQTSK
mmetsp:Transcript_1192/g.1688  ORF Transcript_1192/g.1688 Transcript_1192/m.1688 type:complete len:88 (-) Transcript_1192:557-820(-)